MIKGKVIQKGLGRLAHSVSFKSLKLSNEILTFEIFHAFPSICRVCDCVSRVYEKCINTLCSMTSFCVISNQDYKCVLDFYNWFPFNEAIYCFHNFAHGMRQLKLVWTLASNFIGYKAPFNRNWTIGIL